MEQRFWGNSFWCGLRDILIMEAMWEWWRFYYCHKWFVWKVMSQCGECNWGSSFSRWNVWVWDVFEAAGCKRNSNQSPVLTTANHCATVAPDVQTHVSYIWSLVTKCNVIWSAIKNQWFMCFMIDIHRLLDNNIVSCCVHETLWWVTDWLYQCY